MSWIDLIENKARLPKELVSSELSIRDAILQEIILDYSGPVVKMKLDFGMQKELPKKWQEFNSYVLRLQFVAIENISIQKWSTSNRVEVNFFKIDEYFIGIEVTGESDIKFDCKTIYIDGVDPYYQ